MVWPRIALLVKTDTSMAAGTAGQRPTVRVLVHVGNTSGGRVEDIICFMVRSIFYAGCKLLLLDLLILFQQLLVLFRLLTKVEHKLPILLL
jgi:hypothetical protein